MSPVSERRFAGQPPGVIIRMLREEKGINQRELAERVGHIDAAGVSKIETGVTKLGAKRAARFARALGVDASALLPPASHAATAQDVLDRLESLEAAREVALQALGDALVGIATQLAAIEALLRRRDFGEQAT